MTVHLWITGRVQGVFYRASTQQRARELGLCGWVRNLDDGRVEAIASGPRDKLEALVAWCQHGPPNARVADVRAEWWDASEPHEGFVIQR